MKDYKKRLTWTDPSDKLPKCKKICMRSGTWNVRSMYRSGSLRKVAEEVSKYKLDLVGVEGARWDKSGTEPAGQYAFFYGKANQIINWVQFFRT
jgi:hypothetical protein